MMLYNKRIIFSYGDSTWKDLLTAVNGQTISYDAGGNPVSYLGHTLTWEKERQLKSLDSHIPIKSNFCLRRVHYSYIRAVYPPFSVYY